MKRSIALALALFALPAVAAAQSPSPSPAAAVEKPQITKIARAQFDAWRSGAIDLSLYTDGAQRYFSSGVRNQVQGLLTGLGAVQSFSYAGTRLSQNGIGVETYLITGTKGAAYEIIHVDAQGLIDSIFFTRAPK